MEASTTPTSPTQAPWAPPAPSDPVHQTPVLPTDLCRRPLHGPQLHRRRRLQVRPSFGRQVYHCGRLWPDRHQDLLSPVRRDYGVHPPRLHLRPGQRRLRARLPHPSRRVLPVVHDLRPEVRLVRRRALRVGHLPARPSLLGRRLRQPSLHARLYSPSVGAVQARHRLPIGRLHRRAVCSLPQRGQVSDLVQGVLAGRRAGLSALVADFYSQS